ncbi:hypothetical protein WA171_002499, partial [Blastocystis sp. BT1]
MLLRSFLPYLYRVPYVIAAYLFPSYSSYSSVVKNDVEKQKQWILYWMVLSLFECVFLVTDFLFKTSFVYHFVKFVFIIWLSIPSNGGLTFFSDHVVTPLLRGHADEIDKGLSTGLSYVCGKIKEALNKAIDYVPYLIHSAAKLNVEKTD